MGLRWKLILVELILGALVELAPASLNILEVFGEYLLEASRQNIEACIKYCYVSYTNIPSESFFAPRLS